MDRATVQEIKDWWDAPEEHALDETEVVHEHLGDLIDVALDAFDRRQWHLASDRKPENGVAVLGFRDPHIGYDLVCYDEKEEAWYYNGHPGKFLKCAEPTHWCSVPRPPFAVMLP